jgi:hypothetical protein
MVVKSRNFRPDVSTTITTTSFSSPCTSGGCIASPSFRAYSRPWSWLVSVNREDVSFPYLHSGLSRDETGAGERAINQFPVCDVRERGSECTEQGHCYRPRRAV